MKMKTIYFFLCLIYLITSCDSPVNKKDVINFNGINGGTSDTFLFYDKDMVIKPYYIRRDNTRVKLQKLRAKAIARKYAASDNIVLKLHELEQKQTILENKINEAKNSLEDLDKLNTEIDSALIFLERDIK